ncbi:MAG: hypothetical protein ACI901_000543 [Octadecabacter sp.]|jgi:hypothetical protein
MQAPAQTHPTRNVSKPTKHAINVLRHYTSLLDLVDKTEMLAKSNQSGKNLNNNWLTKELK